MITVSELLEPSPEPWWPLLRQVGVRQVVSYLKLGEQGLRWLALVPGGEAEPWEVTRRRIPPRGRRAWEEQGLRELVNLYGEAGFELIGFEDEPPLDLVRRGLPGRDEQIEWFIDLLRSMGAAGLTVLCYNWSAIGTWARTQARVPARGGARVTAFDEADAAKLPPLDAGGLTPDDLWRNLEYFLTAVTPIAEENGVRLALHPDDPPLPAVRGIPRIMTSLDAFDRALAIAASPANGITLCQGNFALMSNDLPGVIRHFADRINYVHFRDVRGTAESFVETFHDDGQTDLLACLRAYQAAGVDAALRPDHVPTLQGEGDEKPGYMVLGRLHAIGYINGLREAVFGKEKVPSPPA